MTPSTPNVTKAHCNNCGETRHDVMFRHETKWQDEEFHVDGSNVYEMLSCCGCESVKLRHSEFFSEYYDHARNELIPMVAYFPPAASRKLPNWLDSCDEIKDAEHFVPRLLRQVHASLFSQSFDVAAMGLRAALELAMIDKVGDHHSFAKNLEAFESQGYISSKQVTMLDATIQLGNAAIHRNHIASQTDIEAAIDIVETVLGIVYFHPKKAEEIQKRIPPKK